MGVLDAPIVDASSSRKGKIQLGGDLGGTAAAPTVPALTAKLEITVGKSAKADFYTGDYASDDLALQAALNSIPTGYSGGAAIKIMRGVYDFVTGVITPSTVHNLKIYGEGFATILRWKNSNVFVTASSNTNWLITTTSYVIVTDLQMVGNSTFRCPINGINTFAGSGTNALGGGININSARAWIDRVYITGMAEDGITNTGGIGTKYGSVEIIGCGGTGLNITNQRGDNGTGNYATDGDMHSVWIGSCGVGINVSNSGTWIAGAHVWGCQGDGIFLNVDGVRILGGYIETNGGWGINLNGRTRNVIIGNDIWANGLAYTAATLRGGINLGGTSWHNVIFGNHLRENRYHGLLLTGTAQENTVEGNIVTDSFGRNQTTGAAITYTSADALTTNTTFTDSNNPAWITNSNCVGLTLVITGAGAGGATLTTQVLSWSNPSPGVYGVTLQDAMSTATANPAYSVHAVAYGIREQGSAQNNNVANNIVHRFDAQIGQVNIASPSTGSSSISRNNIGVNGQGWVEGGTVSSGSLSPDVRSGSTYHATLGANVTSVTFFPGTPIRNVEIQLIIQQDGTGSRTVTGWGSNVKFANSATPVFSTAAGAVDIISFKYDGTNWRETGRAFQAAAGSVSATWGTVTGTLSAQTDLQAALDAKASTNNAIAYAVALG